MHLVQCSLSGVTLMGLYYLRPRYSQGQRVSYPPEESLFNFKDCIFYTFNSLLQGIQNDFKVLLVFSSFLLYVWGDKVNTYERNRDVIIQIQPNDTSDKTPSLVRIWERKGDPHRPESEGFIKEVGLWQALKEHIFYGKKIQKVRVNLVKAEGNIKNID